MEDLKRLLLRTGLSQTLIESVLHRKSGLHCNSIQSSISQHDSEVVDGVAHIPIVYTIVRKAPVVGAVKDLYEDAVKACCFLNRPDVLKDLAAYIETHKLGQCYQTVNFGGVMLQLYRNYPIDIVMGLVHSLHQKRMLSLLPSFVQSIVDGAVICDDSLTRFMEEVIFLNSDDEQLITDGHEAIIETTQILLNTVRGDMLWACVFLINSLEGLTITDISQVELIKKHFQLIVRLVELFIKHRMPPSPIYASTIFRIAKEHVEVYMTMVNETKIVGTSEENAEVTQLQPLGLHLAKLNAILDGLGEIFRCILLAKSQAAALTVSVAGKHNWMLFPGNPCAIVRIIEYSSHEGHSKTLVRLLLDAGTCAGVQKFKDTLKTQIQETPGNIENKFHSYEIKALECFNEIEFPRSLQYLSRKAIHRALRDRKHHDDAIQLESLSTLGLPKSMIDYCMYC